MPELVVHLSQFDGPLDLLLHLIDRARIDVQSIFVSAITEQYLASLGGIDDLDMDTASAFLAMAAMLLWIKSRAMLPKPPVDDDLEAGEETPEEALVRRLEKHQTVKKQAEFLRLQELTAFDSYDKLPEDIPDAGNQIVLTNLTPDGLSAAWRRINYRMLASDAGHDLSPSIPRDMFTVEYCMKRLLDQLSSGPVSFSLLYTKYSGLCERVTAFIALLELVRKGTVAARQSGIFGEIWIERTPQPNS